MGAATALLPHDMQAAERLSPSSVLSDGKRVVMLMHFDPAFFCRYHPRIPGEEYSEASTCRKPSEAFVQLLRI